ncbi:hypothetical protein BDV33DRAFT_204584 [Aspergillus novoparasiticus]|uniref:Uncharacterized protein n=1 Tax=Aspergillus novoparasiticus TaxID=986946 RepID=A0A5N6EPM1_9EURO|nr:hypothetical protein BDV33DRAFT_204584 [Aspergillus novoparasiticus]
MSISPSKKSQSSSPSQNQELVTQSLHGVHLGKGPSDTQGLDGDWRNWESVDEMGASLGLEEDILIMLKASHRTSKLGFQEWLIAESSHYYRNVKHHFQNQRPSARPLGWPKKSDTSLIVKAYMHFLHVHWCFHLDRFSEYEKICKRLFSATVNTTPELPAVSNAVQKAFHQKASGRRDIAAHLLALINEYYEEYDSCSYLAPYTTIVGPSGIGKSHAIQEIARKGVYVGYCSLAERRSGAYPQRSPITDFLPSLRDRSETTMFFECLVAANLANMKICKDLNISPIDWFELQVRVEFSDFQKALANQVFDMFKQSAPQSAHPRIRSNDVHVGDEEGGDGFNYQEYLSTHISNYEGKVRPFFSSILKEKRCQRTAKSGDSSDVQVQSSQNQVSIILCFDEARGLLNPSLPANQGQEGIFLGFRRALRHQSKISHEIDHKRFFAVLLDTAARVSDFSPPRKLDPSLKWIEPEELGLFPPIYELDTMDILAQDQDVGWKMLRDNLREEHGTNNLNYLYNLGRPLWGAIAAKGTIRGAQDIAQSKIMTNEAKMKETEALALFSYRINFNVGIYDLAQTLTSHYLRYIVNFDHTRSWLLSVQPSEPILAWVSQKLMSKKPDTRLAIIQSFYTNISKGTIHVGDVGELTAAVIMLFSFDRAHGQALPKQVKISNFLSSVFRDNISMQIKSCMGDKEGLKLLWQEGMVFFNHFVRLQDKPSAQTLHAAYYRGAALFPPEGFKGCDLIIPVFLPSQTNMSYIIIQVKNRQNDKFTPGFRNEAKSSLKSAANLLPSTPHLGIMLSLRGKDNQAQVEVVYPKETEKSPRGGGAFGQIYLFNDMERVVVAAVGLDHTIYPSLIHPKDDTNKPHTSLESIEVLRRLVAFKAGTHPSSESSYHKNLTPLG